jgi:hypothetical protein
MAMFEYKPDAEFGRWWLDRSSPAALFVWLRSGNGVADYGDSESLDTTESIADFLSKPWNWGNAWQRMCAHRDRVGADWSPQLRDEVWEPHPLPKE